MQGPNPCGWLLTRLPIKTTAAPSRQTAFDRRGAVARRAIALLEVCKGLLVLALGTGLLEAMHHNIQLDAEWLVRHAHLNPASHFPHIFIQATGNASNSRLLALAAGAALYAAVRLGEGYGLWRDRRWAEVLAAGSGAIYLPFELFALARHPGWGHAALLMVNLMVVAVMLGLLWRRRVRATS